MKKAIDVLLGNQEINSEMKQTSSQSAPIYCVSLIEADKDNNFLL